MSAILYKVSGVTYIGRGVADVPTYILQNSLRVARAERRMSQEELAASAGVTRQTISAIENLQYVPSALLAFLLAASLDKSVMDVFYLEEVGTGGKARGGSRRAHRGR